MLTSFFPIFSFTPSRSRRKRHELKTFVTAVFIAVSVLDLLDVGRVIPVLIEELFDEKIFR